MGHYFRHGTGFIVILAGSLLIGGCATLAVTPPQSVSSAGVKQPVNLGIIVVGERLREALTVPEESAVAKASGRLFDTVQLLPNDVRMKTSTEIQSTFGTNYILTGNLVDISVDGRLNPLFFASLPLFFFKPYAPIVTFEAVVTIEGTLRDARTGTIVLQKEMSSLVTDHFSPVEPQQKVRKMVGRGINNAFISLLEEIQQKITPK